METAWIPKELGKGRVHSLAFTTSTVNVEAVSSPIPLHAAARRMHGSVQSQSTLAPLIRTISAQWRTSSSALLWYCWGVAVSASKPRVTRNVW